MPIEKLSKPKEKFYHQEEKVVISTIDPKVVLDQVFALLGKPKDLAPVTGSQTRATPISQYAFRVNIMQTNPLRLTDTFWVRVDSTGEIVSSNPDIERKY